MSTQLKDKSTEQFTVTRTFDAPLEKVFAAWTTREALGRWWGPKDWDLGVLGFDFQPGGYFHYRMTNRGGDVMWGRMNFLEIEPNRRIVWINAFADEIGNIIPAPFPGGFPREILNSCEFTGRVDKTTITITGGPINASEAERRFYRSMFASMDAGFNGTMNKLEDYLEESDRQIVVSRHFDVPVEKLFEAWTAPDRIHPWWGLDGLTTTTSEFDFRPGGIWRFAFHTPDGQQFANVVRYTAILEPYKIAFELRDHLPEDATGFDVVAEFDPDGDGSRLTFRSLYPTAQARDEALAQGAIDGGNETLCRLADSLTTTA